MRSRPFILRAFFAVCVSAGGRAQTPPPAQQTPPATQPTSPETQQTPAPAVPVNPMQPPGTKPSPPVEKDPNAPAAADATQRPGTVADTPGQLDPANGQPSGGDYTGPSILSRGFNFARPSLPTQARFRPFVGLSALYDSGLTGPYLGPTGKVVSASSFGLDGNFGISGRRYLRKQIFELDYRGHLYYYGGNTRYNGQDHSLAAGYTRYINPHLLLSLHENAGLYSNTYSVLNATSNTDLSTANVSVVVSPNTESFDSRTFYSTTEVDAVYQKSARLSLDFGGSGFFVKRDSHSLVNARGYQARSDAAYRITKRTTIGVYYAYTIYNFSHVYGNSDVHTVGADYSIALSRTLSLKLRAGASRVEVQGLRTVTLDPVVASILGQSTGIERYYQVRYVPDFSGTLDKGFRRASAGISFAEGVSPGNGLYLTSRHESESAYYTYTGIKKYAFSFSGGRDTLQSVGDIVGSYTSYFGRLSASHPLARNFQSIFASEYRHLGFSFSGYGRDEYRISLGFMFAPGEGPLKFW